jgi:hypothetical protein
MHYYSREPLFFLSSKSVKILNSSCRVIWSDFITLNVIVTRVNGCDCRRLTGCEAHWYNISEWCAGARRTMRRWNYYTHVWLHAGVNAADKTPLLQRQKFHAQQWPKQSAHYNALGKTTWNIPASPRTHSPFIFTRGCKFNSAFLGNEENCRKDQMMKQNALWLQVFWKTSNKT